jgi:hypothetical protein
MRVISGLLLVLTPAFSQSPFTVVDISRQFDASGHVKSEARFLLAINRDGSIASVALNPGGHNRQIIDVRNQRNVVINTTSRSVSISPYGSFRVDPPDACDERLRGHIPGAVVSVEKSAGAIEGIVLDRISVHSLNGAGTDMFLAPTLGCHVFRTLITRDGAVVEAQTSTNLQLGDPDPALFDIPPDYRITYITRSMRL